MELFEFHICSPGQKKKRSHWVEPEASPEPNLIQVRTADGHFQGSTVALNSWRDSLSCEIPTELLSQEECAPRSGSIWLFARNRYDTNPREIDTLNSLHLFQAMIDVAPFCVISKMHWRPAHGFYIILMTSDSDEGAPTWFFNKERIWVTFWLAKLLSST